MASETPIGYGVIGGILYLMLNAVLGERKTKIEDPADPGRIAGNAIGAAFVDKSTADAITAIAATSTAIAEDVAAIRAIVEENSEREIADDRKQEMKDLARSTFDVEIRRKLEEIERREHALRHPGEQD